MHTQATAHDCAHVELTVPLTRRRSRLLNRPLATTAVLNVLGFDFYSVDVEEFGPTNCAVVRLAMRGFWKGHDIVAAMNAACAQLDIAHLECKVDGDWLANTAALLDGE